MKVLVGLCGLTGPEINAAGGLTGAGSSLGASLRPIGLALRLDVQERALQEPIRPWDAAKTMLKSMLKLCF